MARYSFSSRIMREVFSKKREMFETSETDVYRLFNGEADGFSSVAIDKYGDYVVVYLYEDISDSEKKAIYDLIEEEFRVHGIYEKKRFQLSSAQEKAEKMGVVRGESAPDRIIVRENGVLIYAYLNEGISTGVFFDQRENRAVLNKYVSERHLRKILNAFSYTGFFSVYLSRKNNFVHTTSVDLSKTASNRCIDNFTLNGIDEKNHVIRTDDFLTFIKRENSLSKKYDLIILDPPTFSRSKKSKSVFSVKKDIFNLALNSMNALNDRGFLFLSVNTENLSEEYLRAKVKEIFQANKINFKEHFIPGQAKDFTHGTECPAHLRCFLFEKI